MKYQMISIGSVGDLLPMICIGKELQRRGHSVRIAAFSMHSDRVRAADLDFFALPGDAALFIEQIMNPDSSPLLYPLKMERVIKTLSHPLVHSLYEACQTADAIICTYFGTFLYAIAAKLGIPCYQVNFFPMNNNSSVPLPLFSKLPFPSISNPLTYDIANLMIAGVERYYTRTLFEREGIYMPPISLDANRTSIRMGVTILYAISEVLLKRPEEWPDNVHMIGFLFERELDDWTPDPALVAFLDAHPNAVYVGFGSMRSGDMESLLRLFIEAGERLRLPLVIAKGWSDVTSAKHGDTCYFLDRYTPHAWLFDRVSAVVHHGGAGTLAAGLRAGKPTLVIPFSGDQPFWGNQLFESGAGPKPLPRAKIDRESLDLRLRQLVGTSAYRANATRIGHALRAEDAIGRACDIIEGAHATPNLAEVYRGVRSFRRYRDPARIRMAGGKERFTKF